MQGARGLRGQNGQSWFVGWFQDVRDARVKFTYIGSRGAREGIIGTQASVAQAFDSFPATSTNKQLLMPALKLTVSTNDEAPYLITSKDDAMEL